MRRQAAYGLAIATVAVATLLTLAIRAVHLSSPFLLFSIAVMASAAFGGFGPGMFAVLLSGVAAVYFLFEPIYSFRITDPAAAIPLVLFGVVGAAITWGVTLLTRARQQAEESRSDCIARSPTRTLASF
jgi:K+-sensing histidine kinase KdpD